MTIRIRDIEEAGSLEKERLVLVADTDDDVGRYAVFQSRLSNEGNPLSGKVPNAYWFAFKPVLKGDLIVLYSKIGSRSEKKNADGTTSHFFYWGLDDAAWQKGNTSPTLVNTPIWTTYKG